jgi:hypothetical protein
MGSISISGKLGCNLDQQVANVYAIEQFVERCRGILKAFHDRFAVLQLAPRLPEFSQASQTHRRAP